MACGASSGETFCPNCRGAMQPLELERHDDGKVRVDVCFGCAGIWFDHLASVQLAPVAVIRLFKEIYAHKDDGRRPRAAQLECPRCEGFLVQSFDLGKAGRFSYFRCSVGDGRFTPFSQFLREKQFVRSLNAAELQRVRMQVRQITCAVPDRHPRRWWMRCSLQIHHEGKAVSPVSGLSDRMFMAGIEAPGSGTWRGLDLVAAGIHSIGHLFDALD
ncbi:MAG: zf-TFIIB domain-containing protein [Steroidobacteraceae bacterium]